MCLLHGPIPSDRVSDNSNVIAFALALQMAALHRDPNGETIFLKSMHVSGEALRRSSVQLEKINVLGDNSCDLKETIDSLRKRNEQLEKLLVQYEVNAGLCINTR